MILETERLILRPLETKDAKSIQENANNLEVSRWLLLLPYPYTLKDAKSWIKIVKKENKQKPEEREGYNFGIELKEIKKAIGGIGLSDINKSQGTVSVGYWLGTKYHKKGYASEALKSILNLAFNTLGLRRIEAKVFAGNEASAKLLEKFGFVKEGFLRKTSICKATHEIKDTPIYGLLKEDYNLTN